MPGGSLSPRQTTNKYTSRCLVPCPVLSADVDVMSFQNPPHLDGVPDMSSLIYLEEDNVVYNLTIRYSKQEIYTYVSSIVIAINPYEKLPIYGPFVRCVRRCYWSFRYVAVQPPKSWRHIEVRSARI